MEDTKPATALTVSNDRQPPHVVLVGTGAGDPNHLRLSLNLQIVIDGTVQHEAIKLTFTDFARDSFAGAPSADTAKADLLLALSNLLDTHWSLVTKQM